MAKKRVFISFDYTNDHRYKDLLLAWNANGDFEFSFENKTPSEIQSNNIPTIKAALSRKINESDVTLVIVGAECNKQHKDHIAIGCKNWQIYEINKTKEVGHKIVAVKLNMYNDSPNELYGSGVSWAMCFTFNSIKCAIDRIL